MGGGGSSRQAGVTLGFKLSLPKCRTRSLSLSTTSLPQNILEFSGLCPSGTSLEPPRGQSGRIRGVHFTDGARRGSRFPAVFLRGPPGSSEWPTRECVMIPGAAGQVFWRWGCIMHPSCKHVWSLLPPGARLEAGCTTWAFPHPHRPLTPQGWLSPSLLPGGDG